MALDYTNTAATVSAAIEGKDLKRALPVLKAAMEKRNGLPVLQTIRAQMGADSITLTTTDLDVALSITLPAIGCEGSAPFQMPADLPNDGKALVWLLCDGETLIVTHAGATATFADLSPANDFPIMQRGELHPALTFPADMLAKAINSTTCGISNEETRYYLNGAYMHAHPATGETRIVATDGHRMTVYELGQPWHGAGLIIPKVTWALLAKLAKLGGDVSLQADKSECRIEFSGPGWRLISKVIDGTFPDYTRVFPREKPVMFFMLAAADLPKAPAGKHALAVKLDADAGRMSWMADGNMSSRDLLADGKGATGFNARYLADFAKIAPDGLTIETSGSGDPARVTTSDSRFLGVVMPMRV